MNQIVRLPGQEEADAIAQDMQIARQGAVAWVRAGLRLADVKARLPHGEFMKWMDSNLQSLQIWKPRHLLSAKAVAEFLIIYVERENRRTYNIDELIFMLESPDGQLAKFIDGKTTTQLTLEAREPKVLDAEKAATEEKSRLECLEWWERNPDDRDEYEPRVLSGELSYVLALKGMRGELNKGKPRDETDHYHRLSKNFNGAVRHFRYYPDLPPIKRRALLDDAIRMARSCPPEIAHVIRKNLPSEGGAE